MTLKNKAFNFLHGIKLYDKFGSENVGYVKGDLTKLIKYDWSKPFTLILGNKVIDEKEYLRRSRKK